MTISGTSSPDARIDAHDHVDHVRPHDPAQLPLHGRLRRPHLPAGQRRRANRHFVKFHWKPKQGLQSVIWNEALKINGVDPDFHRRDMWDAIDAGDFPQWDLGIQVFDEKFAEKFDFDVLDATKIIPEEQVPVRDHRHADARRQCRQFLRRDRAGRLLHAEHRARASTSSNDPLLQGRNFSYLDTQLKRLGGPNFTHIPINAPKCPVRHFQQDGHMAMTNPKGRANYEPNSWGEAKAGRRSRPARLPDERVHEL